MASMLNDATKTAVMAFYNAVQKKWPGFKSRPGQLQMVEHVAGILANAKGEDEERDGANIGVIQGQTGVGKTVGYVVPAVIVGKALKKRVLISTATVALQEQLVLRDLPALQKLSPVPFNVALAKGRARYACNLKLEALSGSGNPTPTFDDPTWERPPEEREISTLKTILFKLDSNQWNGDKDALQDDVDPALWGRIAADRHACLGRNCQRFSVCSYYQARKELVAADVIVANHDLVLAALASGSKLLPDPEQTLYIFDEGHHLPEAAISRFAHAQGVAASFRWLEKLDGVLRRSHALLPSSADQPDVSDKIKRLNEHLRTLYNELVASTVFDNTTTWRFAHGQLPPGFEEIAHEIESLAYDVMTAVTKMAEALADERKETDDREPLNNATLELGMYLPRIDNIYQVWSLLGTHEEPPIAKWVERQEYGRTVDFIISVAPTSAARALARSLWDRAAAVCVTSATIKTLGNFDYYLRSSGLAWYPKVSTLDVASPFDFAKQGVFVIPPMRSTPTDAAAHTAELCKAIPAELDNVDHGALVLFTSKKQMEQVYTALPDDVLADVLMQNTMTRQRLLDRHRERVAKGERSVLFGLQSFGEGLDLPGQLCETVIIAKLPFAPPDSPIEEARAEWLEKNQRNPFMEISVPAAGLKMQQWAGRGIRSETDTARIVCMDTRLATKAYGKQILDGLPPFRREVGGR